MTQENNQDTTGKPYKSLTEQYNEAMGNQPKPKGGFKKISEPEAQKICRDREHTPPMHISLTPGTYEYTCPSCGHVSIVNVPLISY